MVHPGVQPEQLTVQHVRQHRQRMPVARYFRMRRKRPFDAFPCQARLDVRILRDEIMSSKLTNPCLRDRPENRERDQRESGADDPDKFFIVRRFDGRFAGSCTRPSGLVLALPFQFLTQRKPV